MATGVEVVVFGVNDPTDKNPFNNPLLSSKRRISEMSIVTSGPNYTNTDNK